MSAARVTLLITARAPYLCALQEAFAKALPTAGHLTILWPTNVADVFPAEVVMPRGSNISTDVVARLPSLALWKAIARSAPDILWIHELSPWVLTAMLYGRVHRVPVVVSSEVGQRNAHFFSPRTRLWHRLWGKLAAGHIACCPAAREPLAGKAKPVVDAFHAVDSRLYQPAASKAPNTRVRFLYLGQFIHRKGLDYLCAAAAALLTTHGPVFDLVLVGKANDSYATDLIRQHGLSDRVEFTGFLNGDALRSTMQQADVFVLPTRQDTYAAVVQEAACLGLPLLVSHHAGAAEALVEEGATGYAVDPADTAAFASHMAQLLDPALRSKLSVNARQRGEQLSAHERGPAVWRWMQQHFDPQAA